DGARGTLAGNAYIYNKGTGAWTDLSASGTAPANWDAGDEFGTSVAVSGNMVAIGSYLDDTRGANAGTAYLYDVSTTVWTDLSSSANAPASWDAGDQFGRSVDITGNIVVVGARMDATKGSQAGNAYIFDRAADTWTDLAASGN